MVNILKYSFVVRYLSNNQIIVYSGLLETKIPINLHLSTQALSSGMKPLSEGYLSNQPESRSEFSAPFQQSLSTSEFDGSPALIKKLYLNGYTNNILTNDPFFSQMFFTYLIILILLFVWLLLMIFRWRVTEHRFYNSIGFKLFLFCYS